MAFDFKKEYKEFYLPPQRPVIADVPEMQFLAVRGKGDPNVKDGAYSRALGQLYGVAYTLKMSYKGDYRMEGFFEYVVPPLEGLWWQAGSCGMDYARKGDLAWISLLRLPDFVKEEDVAWAAAETGRKKKADFSAVEFFSYGEGLCVQCLHVGPYDDEPTMVGAMEEFARAQGYVMDISERRFHHEIYLSDPQKTAAKKLKTVVRHPIRKMK